MRSIARLRAVVTIQAPGFAGTPSRGQCSAAMTNASWTASSARSKSPSARIRIETARPDSSRNAWVTGSTAYSWSKTTTGRTSIEPYFADGMRAAIASASSASFASIR
jgi:hypothetical protein